MKNRLEHWTFFTAHCAWIIAAFATSPSCASRSAFLGERWYQGTGFGSDGSAFLRRSADGYEFQVSRNFDQGITVSIGEPNGPGYANNFEFVGTVGALMIGHYAGVRDWPGNAPGMRYSISTGAVTNFVGEFDVLEVEYGADGAVEKLAIDFLLSSPSIHIRQFDRGRLRINSALPIPEPSCSLLLIVGVIVSHCRRRRI
jgi:hypothetical protein